MPKKKQQKKEQMNIKLSQRTRERFQKFGSYGDEYEDILIKLMDLAEEVKKKAK